MNCKCIEKIEKELVGREFGHKKKLVTKATMVSAALLYGKGELTYVTSSDLELVVDGYKKPQLQKMIHSFCPFCGTKIEKEKMENWKL